MGESTGIAEGRDLIELTAAVTSSGESGSELASPSEGLSTVRIK
jgi:hypothetical protein